MPPNLYLIDGHALAYRTYYALTHGAPSDRWMTSKGEPTAGVYGFISVLFRIFEQEQPDYLAVAFDVGKTFRDEKYPEYKATREKMPDDLRPQIKRIKQIVDAFSIPRLERENYEADDVLGSAAKWASNEGYGVKIITGDKDLLQLVDKRISVNLPGRSLADAKDYMEPDVIDLLGITPKQVVDYKALVGDPSDNIPGVRGIGKKTAVSLLTEFGDLDTIYKNLDSLRPHIHKKLINEKENAYLSQYLATIVTSLDVKIDMDEARPDHYDSDRVIQLFRELEFRSLLTRFSAIEKLHGKGRFESEQLSLFADSGITQSQKNVETQHTKTKVISTSEDLTNLANILSESKIIAFDTETTSTEQMETDLVGISLAINSDEAYYIPINHKDKSIPQLPIEEVISSLKPALTNPEIGKIGHNVKFDYLVLVRNGLTVSPISFDTMIAEWVINPASRNLGLKNLVFYRFGYQMVKIKELIGSGRNQISMAEVPIEKAAPYAGDDAALVMKLMPVLKAELHDLESYKVMEELDTPLIAILAEMELNGIEVDKTLLSDMSEDFTQRIQVLISDIHAAVGYDFNVNSTEQLSKALFNTLGLKPPDRTKKTVKGFYSTAASVLEQLRTQNPIITKLLEYRELTKLKSTYVDSLPEQVNPYTGRIHTSYVQTGTVTGRIASNSPNLQNIPIRSELGRKVRNAFISSPGNTLLAVDYSQIELRITAHMSQDESMISAFREGQDIHAATAAAIFGVPLDEIDGNHRRHAKAINFGLIYGMSPFGLTRTTDLTLAEAEDFVRAYFDQFPDVKVFLEEIKRQVHEDGYVTTMFGRRRYFPELKYTRNNNIRNRIEREAINSPIQGSAADIMKLAMIDLAKQLPKLSYPVKMLLQVHDELVLEYPKGKVFETAKMVQSTMEDVHTLKVPIKTDAKHGLNWGTMVPILDN